MGDILLKDYQDAFGHAILDYHKGTRNFEIVERDDGYIDSAPVETYFSKYKDWPKIYKEAMGYVNRKVLDIGCGAGRHLIYLQEKRINGTGIDISPLAVKVCKMRGIKNVKNIPITKVSLVLVSLILF